ncbi:threonine synthase [Actinophytocola xanthii]|uniref:Threonine synthase n=1 Tax=Actinophytocola xanthii TaxID=1912961 RepID=A0A1Q8CC32_9PSEU|nr:threonine synthase [Actinophytocola xanthii]OLF11908.1 threonine synthase [Actinophytocola xanthii]
MPEPWHSALTHLECARCGIRHDASVPQNLCACGSPLLARYDLERVGATVAPADLAERGQDLWRYRELLPVAGRENAITLGEGMTPILPLARYGHGIGVPGLLVKDEGLLPTGSFKARGAAVGVSRARELGIEAITMPTNGNAGAAWAAYAARAGLRSLVVMPEDAPRITRMESALAGARLYVVDGLIGDAGAIAAQAVADGWFSTATLREPYRVEGKKTMGLEIVEQLGWRAPDVIVYPTGGGVGLIGIHKALEELRALGWLTGPAPRLVVVQAAGCAPLVRAFEAGSSTAPPWPDPRTFAYGVNVASTLGDFLVLDAVRSTGGTAVAVADEDILAAQAACAAAEGLVTCPEGAATLAAVARLRESGWLTGEEEVVVLNTGSGLKYPPPAGSPEPPHLAPGATLPD